MRIKVKRLPRKPWGSHTSASETFLFTGPQGTLITARCPWWPGLGLGLIVSLAPAAVSSRGSERRALPGPTPASRCVDDPECGRHTRPVSQQSG